MGKKGSAKNPSDNLDDINAAINTIVKSMIGSQHQAQGNSPVIYRFDIRVDTRGVTVANPNPGAIIRQPKLAKAAESEPLIDVIEHEASVIVTADMPGIERGKLSLFADSGSLSITSKGRRAYNTTIDLPSQVDPRGAHAFYNNGVLQVELTKSRSYEGKGIKIEMS